MQTRYVSLASSSKILSAVACLIASACAEGSLSSRAPGDLDAQAAAAGADTSTLQPTGPGTVRHRGPSGQPSFVWADPVDPAVLAERQKMGPQRAARAYLRDYATTLGIDADVVENLDAGATHDTGTGPIVVQFKQRLNTFEVFRAELKVAMRRDHQLVAISGAVSPNVGTKTKTTRLDFATAQENALTFAFKDVTGTEVVEDDWQSLGDIEGGFEEFTARAAARLIVPARVKRIVYPEAGGLEPAYYLEVNTSVGSNEDYFAYVISAKDGKLLFRKNLTEDAAAFSYRVYANDEGFPLDGPQGDAAPHPTGLPNGFDPAYVGQSLVTLSHGPISTEDPWLPDNALNTIGNNVAAYADITAPDGFGPGDVLPTLTGPRSFDRVFDPTQQPGASVDQMMSATTTLFYLNNFLHDWFYDAGFKEVDGNAQLNNYGRGGLQNDSLKAEAQDTGGINRNNANMSTPADGAQPRMQMYIFDGVVATQATVLAPAGLSFAAVAPSALGAQQYDLTGTLAALIDDTEPTLDGCTDATNAPALAGKIAVVERGTCGFADKIQRAQNAGAIAVLVLNNQPTMLGSMGGTSTTITVPSVLIDQASGDAVKAALAAGTQVSVRFFRPQRIDRDGTLDNLIVAHEWGHYISNRLVGNAVGLSTPQARGLGEGWGDFTALLLTVKESDAQRPNNANFSGAYPIAGFTQSGAGNNGHYFGIRRAPYSTNFAVNPLTLKHIEDGVPLPVLEAPRSFAFGQNGASNSQVHNTGEVWASMLWECYAALLNDDTRGLSFADKQQRMKQYLVAAFKLTPVAPTILEARDAVLAAALAGDEVDYEIFYRAFARRGAGLRAVAPGRTTAGNAGVVESFEIGPDLQVVAAAIEETTPRCEKDGVLSNDEAGLLSVTVKNVGIGTVEDATGAITTTTPGVRLSNDGAIRFAPVKPLAVTTTAAGIALFKAPSVLKGEFELQAATPDSNLAPAKALLTVLMNWASKPAASATDDVESPAVAWAAKHDSSLAAGGWQRVSEAVDAHYWYGPNLAAPADVYLISPAVKVKEEGSFKVTLKHRFLFEYTPATEQPVAAQANYDGGVIEISTDGLTWEDVGAELAGYNGTLETGSGKNPLGGRPAFVAESANLPEWNTLTLDFGSKYAGRSLLLRFRIGTDEAVAFYGWEIDDVSFENIDGTPFATLIPTPTRCVR